MAYLDLPAAAAEIQRRTGQAFSVADLMRMGIEGRALICALFSGLFYNLNAHSNQDFVGLLVIPPRYLLEIDVEGETKVLGAFTLDGRACLAVGLMRKRDHLKLQLSEIERIVGMLGQRDDLPGQPPKPVQRQASQEQAILAALKAHGHDPLRMPAPPPGNKPWPLRESIREELGFSAEVMRKAWKRLRQAGQIQDA